jgi:CheY-like chemotaxis protein
MTTKQATILIVDDEAVIRSLLYRKLSSEGYLCQEAGDDDEAVDKLKSSPIELVLLDIKMGGKSGAELLPEIKAGFPDTQ